MQLDVQLLYFLNGLAGKSPVLDSLIVFLASYLQYLVVGAFIMFALLSAYSKRDKLYIFATGAISVIVARLGITEIIRFLYHRPRPFLTHNLQTLISNNNWSFPSGHSAVFFALAMSVYFYNKKWGAGFFVAALLINISRIIAGIHYPSDILGGAIVGIISAWAVFYLSKIFYNKPYGKKTKPGYQE